MKYLIIALFVSIIGYGQDINRNKRLHFNIGPEYRITPIYKINDYSDIAGFTTVDLQNSGVGINIGAEYFFKNNFGIGYANSFRYDLITNRNTQNNEPLGVSKSIKGLLIGYHFKAFYYFNLFKKGELFIEGGFSLLNRGSEFSYSQPIIDNNGNTIGSSSILASYKFSANKLTLGYKLDKSKFMLGTYISTNSGFFQKTTTFIVPFISYTYDFAKL